MKKIFFISSIVASFIGMINAQTAQTSNQRNTVAAAPVRTPETRAKDKVAQITKSSTLNQEQVGRINSLFIDFYSKQDALKAKQKELGAGSFEKQMADLKTQHNNSLKAVLTAEQLKTYEAAELKRQERNASGKPGN